MTRASRALICDQSLEHHKHVCIEATYSFPWTSSSMGFFAEVLNLHPRVCCCPDKCCIWRDTWMSHQRDVDVVIPICAGIQEANLASATLCRK